MRQHVASFANFICRFGDEKVMLDYAKEIVLPAFTDDKLVRSYGRTHFFFYEVELVNMLDDDTPVLGIAGRFIKNTELSREQIFDPIKGLIKDEASIASAPSVHFILILNSHRLIYFPETSHAPDLSAFKSTSLHFIKRKHKEFIDKLYKELNLSGDRITKKSLYQTHPFPTLEMIPISGEEEIESFVRRYEVLKKIEFRVIRPNDEIDAGEMFNEIRDFLGPIQPTDTKLITSRAEGFDIEGALPRIKSAVETANQEIKLSGKDTEGNDLRGDNHKFKISAPVDTIPATRKGLTKKLFNIFQNLKQSGAISIGQAPDSISQKIRDLKSLF